jgi:hypothetical protein
VDRSKIEEIRLEVEAAVQEAADAKAAMAEPVVPELAVEEPSVEVVEEAPVVAEAPEPPAPEPPAIQELPVLVEAAVEPEPVPVPTPVAKKPLAAAPKAPQPLAEPEQSPGVLGGLVTDLESSLGDQFLPGTQPRSPEPKPAQPAAHAAAASATSGAVLGKFVADIEASLGEDFLRGAPVEAPQAPAPVAPQAAAPVAATPARPSMAASAAASARPVAPPAAVVHTAPTPGIPGPPPSLVKPPIAPAAPASKASPFGEDAGVDLAEMFGELKQDLEADVAAADEDPETHYNLGIAFREMGLLDEAIGELQKACQAFDRGHPFPQIMQTYTWLAQCFLEKSVPEAAVRWYQKALNVNGIDGETRTALNYELASAFEAAGDKTSALKHFTEVYGSNIDYRDVAERIKALKS